jgi:acetyl esterase/lipase
MKSLLPTALVAMVSLSMVSRVHAQKQDAVPLWPDGAPGALGTKPTDTPSLTPYVSASAPAGGATIVILPGGGYQNLAQHEGNDFAVWLNQQGITTFVLQYRLARDGYHHPAMLNDAARAVRWVRANAQKYNIDPKRVGIMGSSAGGHLASTLLTHFDAGKPDATDPVEKESSRPDFGILCYPVITMGPGTHAGSKNGLIGADASPELVAELSNELHVTAQTPPCFIWHGINDRTVPVANSLNFAAALQKAGVPYDLHIYQNAPHGQGLGDRTPPFAHPLPWTQDLLLFLKTNKVLPVASAAPTSAPAPRTP